MHPVGRNHPAQIHFDKPVLDLSRPNSDPSPCPRPCPSPPMPPRHWNLPGLIPPPKATASRSRIVVPAHRHRPECSPPASVLPPRGATPTGATEPLLQKRNSSPTPFCQGANRMLMASKNARPESIAARTENALTRRRILGRFLLPAPSISTSPLTEIVGFISPLVICITIPCQPYK